MFSICQLGSFPILFQILGVSSADTSNIGHYKISDTFGNSRLSAEA